MKLSRAIEILDEHQKWRLGCDKTEPTKPKELTSAINEAVIWLRGLRDAEEFIKKLSYTAGQLSKEKED